MTAPGGDTAGLSPERLAEIQARFTQLGGMVDNDASDVLAELSRLRALLREQNAQELIDELRDVAELHTLLGRKCLCQRCMTSHRAADLLSQLLAAPSTGGEQ